MHDEQTCRDVYSKGVPLSQVFDRFSSPAWKRAHHYARKRDAAKAQAILFQTIAGFQNSQTKAAQTSLSDYGSNKTADVTTSVNSFPHGDPSRYRRLLATRKPNAIKYETDLHEAIWQGVLKGAYLVLGFEIPRKASDPPAYVPDDVWRRWLSIRWRESQVEGNGLKFEAVRLLPKSWLVSEVAKENTSQSSTKPVAAEKSNRGPRSRNPEVIATYRELFERGEIKKGESYKSVWNKVRAKIERDTDDPKGLGYTTVFPFLKKLH